MWWSGLIQRRAFRNDSPTHRRGIREMRTYFAHIEDDPWSGSNHIFLARFPGLTPAVSEVSSDESSFFRLPLQMALRSSPQIPSPLRS